MAWWETAKPGDKVVCVKQPTKTKYGETPSKLLLKNVYIIEEVSFTEFDGCNTFFKINGFLFSIFAHRLFLPVQPKSTDKAFKLLKSITAQTKIKEPEDA